MGPRDWTNLQLAVENENCILLLGPGASGSVVDGKFVPFTSQFSRLMAAELEAEKMPFDPASRDDLDYVAQIYLNFPGSTELDAAYKAKPFYQKEAKMPPTFLVNLARLPFKIVINTTPDYLFFEALRMAGKVGRQADFYNFSKPEDPVKGYRFKKPTIEEPLVFNLFGHFEEPNSLVLTSANQVELVRRLCGASPMPTRLLEECDSKKTFLFVGFDWREWHLQVLLKTLNLSSESMILAPRVEGFEPNDVGKQLYESIFKKFKFVDLPLENFVADLASKFPTDGSKKADDGPKKGKKVFISYSFASDDGLKDQLFAQLKTLETAGLAQFWDEEKLAFGEDRDSKIAAELGAAELILLFLTAEYLSDDGLAASQLRPALERFSKENLPVVSVVLKPCPWKMIPELKSLSPILPIQNGESGKAATTWTNLDEAFSNVVEEIKKLL